MTQIVATLTVCSLGLAALIPAALPAPRDRDQGSLQAPKNDDFSSGNIVMGSGSGSGAPSCPADLDGDGTVGGGDLGLLLSGWGTASGDISGDNVSNGKDLGILLSAWGPCL